MQSFVNPSEFCQSLRHPAPRVINTDGHAAYPPAVAQLKAEGALAQRFGSESA